MPVDSPPKEPKAVMMKYMTLTSIFLFAIAVPLAVRAEELCPIQAKSLRLGGVSGVAYYSPRSELPLDRHPCRTGQQPRAVREHAVAWAKGFRINAGQRKSRYADD
jgi:hypothetical protein